MSGPAATVQAETYATADVTPETFVMTAAVVQSEQISRYINRDLLGLVNEHQIDLKGFLGVASDSPQDLETLVTIVCCDIERMLRSRLVLAVHLILSDTERDPNRGGETYKMRYWARYVIDMPELAPLTDELREWGAGLNPVGDLSGTRFTLLVEWDPEADEEDRKQVRYPEYLLNWVPEEAAFDSSAIYSYRFGGLAVSGAEVRRAEGVPLREHR